MAAAAGASCRPGAKQPPPRPRRGEVARQRDMRPRASIRAASRSDFIRVRRHLALALRQLVVLLPAHVAVLRELQAKKVDAAGTPT